MLSRTLLLKIWSEPTESPGRFSDMQQIWSSHRPSESKLVLQQDLQVILRTFKFEKHWKSVIPGHVDSGVRWKESCFKIKSIVYLVSLAFLFNLLLIQSFNTHWVLIVLLYKSKQDMLSNSWFFELKKLQRQLWAGLSCPVGPLGEGPAQQPVKGSTHCGDRPAEPAQWQWLCPRHPGTAVRLRPGTTWLGELGFWVWASCSSPTQSWQPAPACLLRFRDGLMGKEKGMELGWQGWAGLFNMGCLL